MRTPFFKSTLAILFKDLRAELRSRELISAMGLFALLSIFAFSFALELDRTILRSAATGILWVTIVFSIILGLNRNLAAEREQGNLDAMLLAPIDRASIFVGKMTANFLFGLLVGLILLPLMAVIYNVDLVDWRLIGVVVLGTLGLSSIGTLLAAMTVQTRARETLLPIVMLPSALPILLLVVRSSNGIINGQPEEFWIGMPPLLLVLDLIYLVMCYLLFPYVLED
jgi:heme exporter protein B